MHKVLLLGSGGLQVGQAGEFDYSGSQAIKAFKEEGIYVILVNPNIATIQTDEKLADKIYFLPVTPEFVEQIIIKEKPDSIALSFGGQTALNCGLALYKNGILEKYNVKVLGTPISAIEATEDREIFVKKLKEINLDTPRSKATHNMHEAKSAAAQIGYPIMIRSGFALGGLGSGLCKNENELERLAIEAFSYSSQVLVEEYLFGWKEVEYEVVRDSLDNCITVCNMENFDPLGIHTGESIVVAPSQTLSDREYHKLREIAIKAIRHFGIIGECNIQYALDPKSEEYRIIEVNARLSRSSALASKATGYPLAYVAAKLILGYKLTDLQNSITKVTQSCFEPALDYVVVKIPKWDFKKFRNISKKLGSSMKSVGEVMAIGRKFEEALQKAIRMLDIGYPGLSGAEIEFDNLTEELSNPTDDRLIAIARAIKIMSIDEIYNLTRIDKWFLYKIKNIVDLETKIEGKKLDSIEDEILNLKQHGFSDKSIAIITKSTEIEVREKRHELKIRPYIKQIDTLSAEFPAKTNYLYLTYNGNSDDVNPATNSIIVLGSGVYRIGSSVEFDWCCVNTILTIKELGYNAIVVNYNPETVSTDYDIGSRLYFEELTFETVNEIYFKENPNGIILSMGGQISNNLAMKCQNFGMKVLGTSALNIDKAENRHKFSSLLDSLDIDQPHWKELTTNLDAFEFAKKIGYPVLVRPSYVLSGAAMNVAYDEINLEKYLAFAAKVSSEYPVVLSKFILGAKEIEIDAVAKNGEIEVFAITEHVENAGVHSGDATVVLPPWKIYAATERKVLAIAKKISAALQISGPFNIQFLARKNEVKVIECNLRVSRSFPFVSKVYKKNFAEIAAKIICGAQIPKIHHNDITYVGVKTPQFSFTRFKGADPILGVEMASTGEVACLGDDIYEALLKAIQSTGFKMPKTSVLLAISGDKNRYDMTENLKQLSSLGFELFATKHTHDFLLKNGIKSTMLYKVHEKKEPNAIDQIKNKKIDLVINIPHLPETEEQSEDLFKIRRTAADMAVPLITNLQLAKLLIEALHRKKKLKIKSWDEYG